MDKQSGESEEGEVIGEGNPLPYVWFRVGWGCKLLNASWLGNEQLTWVTS